MLVIVLSRKFRVGPIHKQDQSPFVGSSLEKGVCWLDADGRKLHEAYPPLLYGA